MYIFEVEVKIHKGIDSSEYVIKSFSQAYDDVEEMTYEEAVNYAKADTNHQLENSDDFVQYGRNWEILNVYEA